MSMAVSGKEGVHQSLDQLQDQMLRHLSCQVLLNMKQDWTRVRKCPQSLRGLKGMPTGIDWKEKFWLTLTSTSIIMLNHLILLHLKEVLGGQPGLESSSTQT